MDVPEPYLDQLRQAHLLVSEPFVPYHTTYPSGYMIGKPCSAGGNALAHYVAFWGDDSIPIDAPVVYFHAESDAWIVTVAEAIPGPGPHDFVHRFPTPEAAVADILEYFFGAATRMRPPS